MNANSDPLVEDYLNRLTAAASALPPDRREELVAEIRDHVEEGLRRSATRDEVSVRNLLERLGPPEEIVGEATEPAAPGPPGAPAGETNASAVVSLVLSVLWLIGIGSVLALVFGYRARRQISESGGGQKGLTLATLGIVLGWVGIALVVLVVLGGLGFVARDAGSTSLPVPTG